MGKSPPKKRLFRRPLDLHLPGRDGISFIPVIKQRVPDAEIIVLTQDDNYLKPLEAIRLGVAGYLLKGVFINEIWNATRTSSLCPGCC